jgi:hypothetical protein
MAVKIHFETLTSGMKARLDARYRTQNSSVPNIRKLYENGFSNGFLYDAVGKCQQTLAKRNR